MNNHPHTNPNQFLGEWKLIPDKCTYEAGTPPLSGLYTLSQGKEGPHHVDISIKWKTTQGEDMSHSYNITTDATPVIHTYGGQDLRVVSHIDVDGHILKSVSSTLGGKVFMEATRELIEQNNKLEVVMLIHKEDKVVKLYQIYERVAEGKS